MNVLMRVGEWAGQKGLVRGLLFPIYLAAILLGMLAVTGLWWLLPFAIGLAAGATVVVVAAVARDPDAIDTRIHLR